MLSSQFRLPFFDQLRVGPYRPGPATCSRRRCQRVALRYRLMTSEACLRATRCPRPWWSRPSASPGGAGRPATFTAGVALALPGIWSHPLYVLAGLAGAAALVSLSLTVWARGHDSGPTAPARHPTARHVARSRASRWLLAFLVRTSAAGRSVLNRSQVLLQQRRSRWATLGWAGGNWLLDAASLWVCLSAYGVVVRPGALLAAYGAANLVGLLPATPGGLGVIEGVLIPSLILLGAAGGPVVLGVLTWRAIEFWLPIPVSGLTYLSLRLGRREAPSLLRHL